MYAHRQGMYTRAQMESRRSVGSPGTGLMGGCESFHTAAPRVVSILNCWAIFPAHSFFFFDVEISQYLYIYSFPVSTLYSYKLVQNLDFGCLFITFLKF